MDPSEAKDAIEHIAYYKESSPDEHRTTADNTPRHGTEVQKMLARDHTVACACGMNATGVYERGPHTLPQCYDCANPISFPAT